MGDDALKAEMKRLQKQVADQNERLATATRLLEDDAARRAGPPTGSSAAERLRRAYAGNDEREAAWNAQNPDATGLDRIAARQAGFPITTEDDA
jgi:hypothetical protein